ASTHRRRERHRTRGRARVGTTVWANTRADRSGVDRLRPVGLRVAAHSGSMPVSAHARGAGAVSDSLKEITRSKWERAVARARWDFTEEDAPKVGFVVVDDPVPDVSLEAEPTVAEPQTVSRLDTLPSAAVEREFHAVERPAEA